MVTKQRLAAKKIGDMVTADALKITINSIYGKLGFEFGYLYSPKSMYAVTINGQLMLLNLIEKMELAGMECFYANTDGATFKVHKSKVKEFYAIGDAYSEYVDIPIEYANYAKCLIRDVNNYIIVDTDGKRKIKGAFSSKPNLSGAFNMPVVAMVAEKVLVDGADILTELKNHTDMYDFCKAQKTGGQFTTEYHELVGTEKVVTSCQKTNRYIVTNNGGKLFKAKEDSLHDLVSGFRVDIFNDHHTKPIDINYGYYSREVRKLITAFDTSQLTLF